MIFLVGMPGSGKSYWLHPFAEVIKYKPIDLDEKIEQKYQRPIARAFKNKEEEFRIAERAMLTDVINNNNNQAIIATGGGTPCYFDNIDLMKEHGTIIYLKAENDLLFERFSKDLNKRPFLPKTKKGLTDYLDELLKKREPFYEQADLILPVKYLNVTFFLDQITPFLKK